MTTDRKQALADYVLGGVLTDWRKALDLRIVAEDFTSGHRRIFVAAMKAAAKGEVDQIAVLEELRGTPSDFDLARHLLTEGTFANTARYLAELRELNRLDKVRNLLREAVSMDGSAADVCGHVVSGLANTFREQQARAFDAKSAMIATVDYLDALHTAATEGKRAGVPTGIERLDAVIGGMHPSDLIVVGARPAMGKTALALNIALHAAQQGRAVGVISTEMSIQQLGARMVAQVARIDANRLRTPEKLEPTEWDRVSGAMERIQPLPIKILDQPSCRPSDIALQARQWRMCGGLDILLVDYLTRLRPDRPADRKDLEVGENVAALKTLARDLDIPVVVLAQLSRDVEKRTDKRPTMADLRESGMIEQEADQVWMLYRDSVYNDASDPRSAEIILEKNRHGGTGIVRAEFVPELMLWRDA